ncbi:MAG: trypsin-like peptidase domain-containing protein [Polyangiaceae bacterium]|nr:trypsin-like peptidase domain-containing protein [Polyangiaceae bacterium]
MGLRVLLLLATLVYICGCGQSSSGAASGAATATTGAIATSRPASAAPQVTAAPVQVVVSNDGRPLSFAPLVKRSNPSVATIKSRVVRETAFGGRRTVGQGLGTGFVYDSEGYLLTNHHVIAKANEVTVRFLDGHEANGTVVGSDRHTDIAVVKVEEKNLPALPLGDSDVLEVGDWVMAIGNPFGLSHSASAGIVSAKGRTRDDVRGLDPSGYFNFLQTDASINPGNSGGPLLNLKGEVIGINAAVRANANGIGFAIPINMVKQLLPMLLRDGKIRRSAIGVEVLGLNPVEALRLKRPDTKGAWVQGVRPGSPADRAGIAADDVIVAFNSQPIADPDELRWLASIAGVGTQATVKIARQERVFDVKVTLGELPEAPEQPDEEP